MNTKNLPSNLKVFSETGAKLIFSLARKGISSGHFTNGTYAPPQSLIMPTVLAAFQHAIDKEGAQKKTALIVAINSDVSMAAIMDKKIVAGTATEADKAKLESQVSRTEKVAIPLAIQNPDRQVVVMYYDEETPNKLYALLSESGFDMKSLFKWGYGTDPSVGVIEGAEYFGVVYGHPLPNDIKPICAELTRMTGQAGSVQVVDLRTEIGNHGKPYISAKSECLFPLDGELVAYGVRGDTTPELTKPELKS